MTGLAVKVTGVPAQIASEGPLILTEAGDPEPVVSVMVLEARGAPAIQPLLSEYWQLTLSPGLSSLLSQESLLVPFTTPLIIHW